MEEALSQKAAVELWYGARKQSALSPPATRTTGSEGREVGTGMKIAIQGEPGSFSHEATLAMLPDAVIVPCSVSADVFNALANESADGAVIPIENSLAGSVLEHFDLLLQHDVKVVRESQLRIRHNLIGISSTLDDIDRVFSHPVALAQCRHFLARHTGMRSFAFYDTAGSVKHVISAKLNDAAGIAGRQAAREYAGSILESGIEDDKRNFTRFFLIRNLGRVGSRATKKRGGADYRRLIPRGANKTSIVFQVKNVPGALFKSLSVFALRDISLSKIESRPMRGRPWEYVFYVDFLRGDDEPARNALRHLEEVAEFVKVLGIYPAA